MRQAAVALLQSEALAARSLPAPRSEETVTQQSAQVLTRVYELGMGARSARFLSDSFDFFQIIRIRSIESIVSEV
jgi:hypothetical protein